MFIETTATEPLTQRISSPERILICCAGLGMGNASRVIAVVEALHAQAEQNQKTITCRIVTWGSALTFLQEYKRESKLQFELIEAHAYWSTASVRGSVSPAALFNFMKTFIRNVKFLRATVKAFKPALIILDSDYHFPAYFKSGCPIVYIGQANDVLERAKRDDYRPASLRERLNFNLREKLDSVLQSLFSNWVLVPSFSCSGLQDRKVKKIPLIVRKEFLESVRVAGSKQSVGILLSGSELEKSAFLAIAGKYDLKILTPGKDQPVSTVPSHAGTLDEFDIIFTQGGLSSISECIARAKFLVVFPMSHHPEQLLNAVEVEQLGLGMRSNLEDLNSFPELLEKIARKKAHARKIAIGCNGAEVAAGFIFQALSQINGQPLSR
ncbi:MAG: glycosyltransferase family protein [Bdellovibrionales bacterium]